MNKSEAFLLSRFQDETLSYQNRVEIARELVECQNGYESTESDGVCTIESHGFVLGVARDIVSECPECGLGREAGYGDHGCERCGT